MEIRASLKSGDGLIFDLDGRVMVRSLGSEARLGKRREA